jgi:DNA polymerase I-like protein with 3'-5' exonuclease and polymerase domains
MFWQDIATKKRGDRTPRQLAEIPHTEWRCPTYFPNLASYNVLSIDVETYDPELIKHGPGWARGKGHIVGYSIATDDGGRWYYPLHHQVRPEENHPYPDGCMAWLKDTLYARPSRYIIGANLTYDCGWLRHEGITVPGPKIDIQFGEALLDDRAKVNLENLATKYLRESKTTDLLKKWVMDSYAPPKDYWRREIYRSPPSLVGPYGEGDADLPIRIAPIMFQQLYKEGLTNLFEIECGLIDLLVEMRFEGVSVDLNRAEQLRDVLAEKVVTEQKVVDLIAGFGVNVDASESLAKAFDKLGIKYPRTKPTKGHKNGQPSFRREWLDTVEHPFAGCVRQVRRFQKLKNTFVEGYILGGNVDKKIYASFHPLRGEAGGTIVGRFSGSHPNLQNVPVREEQCVHGNEAKDCPNGPCIALGKLIRSIFIPDDGHVAWRKYDYSQIQFRYLVHFAVGPGADEARARYNREPDTDYHAMVKTMVDERTGRSWDRRPVKNLNFGLAFGMGNEKAGVSTGLEGEELKEFIKAYHLGVPFSKKTMQHIMEMAKTTGVVQTILGRKARFDLWEREHRYDQDEELAPNGKPYPALPFQEALMKYGKIQRAYLHTALAKRLQGSEGDTIKTALYRCWKEGVYRYTGVPRLLVHDEKDFSMRDRKPETLEAFEYMHHVMETCVQAKVPIIAECDEGPDWGNCKTIKKMRTILS